jgi:hypothetical protein
MHRRAILVVVFMSSVLVWAADKDFWDTKPYTEWNDKEVEKLLKNSPWCRTVSLSVGMMGAGGYGNDPRQQGPRPAGGGGNQPGTGNQTGTGNQGTGGLNDPGGARSPGGFDPSERTGIPLVISWYSRPVREALARRIQLRKPEGAQEQVDNLLKYDDPQHFAILITGIPMRMPGDVPAEMVQRLKEDTFLQKKNKEKIPVAEVVEPKSPGQPLVLKFLNEADGKPVLTLEDKEVEFYSRLAGDPVRAKFKLADMVVNGKLEL